MERLQKYLSASGVASRRAAEQLIVEGRVRVNGRTAQVGESIDPASDRVEVDGRPVQPEDRKVYILLNKPRGTITSAKDTHGRDTVLDRVSAVGERVFPVGRLDLDVEGALLLTNDGELAFRLTHPSYEVDKVYLAWVKGIVTPETAARLRAGVVLDDGKTAPAKVIVLRSGARATMIQITLHEGRKREVKRMCAAVGHPVRELQRVAFANLRLGELKPGEWRHLTPQEVEKLKHLVGLDSPRGPRPSA